LQTNRFHVDVQETSLYVYLIGTHIVHKLMLDKKKMTNVSYSFKPWKISAFVKQFLLDKFA